MSAIEVDPAVLANHDDEDYASSGYDTDTTSLTSSVTKYIFENGRRYHAYFGVDKNLMPTDEKEQDRMDLHHEIMLCLLDRKLHTAPLENPQRILDVGTGTGIWAIDMADSHPSAVVTGIDLSPIQPSWVPPNCKFEVDDVEKPWMYKPDTFDFIHSRNLAQSISKWPELMKDMYRCTKPGGYVELAETEVSVFCDDGSMKDSNGLKRTLDLLTSAVVKMGRPPPTPEVLTARLADAGFTDIHCITVKQPVGPWPKDRVMKQVGAMALMTCETGIEAYALAAITRIHGMPTDEATQLCKDGLKDARNKNYHMYCKFHVAYGKKPEASED